LTFGFQLLLLFVVGRDGKVTDLLPPKPPLPGILKMQKIVQVFKSLIRPGFLGIF